MPAGPAAGQPQTEARPFPHGGAGVMRMAKVSERQIALGRRTARVCCSIDGRCIAAEVLKNPLNHGRILDAGDHPELPAATSSNLYADGEHALEALRPSPVVGRWPMARRTPWPFWQQPPASRARSGTDPGSPERTRRDSELSSRGAWAPARRAWQ